MRNQYKSIAVDFLSSAIGGWLVFATGGPAWAAFAVGILVWEIRGVIFWLRAISL